ncbi:unnamed protein product [Adineta ricciae]|uniref:F-box domain-containing protein n=1 Tax=Adineta ricciae TaxID=249248 RepID=A0A815K5W7_ADIRI|nr:unnamed protein product [Adineta ricciae]CAF1393290.1 unnamed protein product [Adineta ricciae]
MDNSKRKLTFTKSSEENSKKSRNESINSFENLCNDIFYEICDYLEGLDICRAFLNLNSRFQQLLKHSSIRLKINIYNSTQKDGFFKYSKVIKRQIHSISLQILRYSLDEFFSIDRSFHNLQSISIGDIESDQLISFLIHLRHLPCLYSLNIKTTDLIDDLNEIYQFIFSLPKLKSSKLDLFRDELSISTPISNKSPRSPIEFLYIVHYCTFDELSIILSCTPFLRHLKLPQTNKNHRDLRNLVPMNLNYLSICISDLNFAEFELFIGKIHSNLKILHINFAQRDIRFLRADCWQKLLSQQFPQLENFSLCYRESGFRDEHPAYDGELNSFVSPFWVQLNLIFDIEIREDANFYFIRSLKKRWYQHSLEHSKSTQLTIKYVYSYEPVHLLLQQIKRVLNFTQIYHLNIEQKISTMRLMEILHLLPDLITLKINSLSLYQTSFRVFERELGRTSAFEHANNIKCVYLEKTFTTKDISFLISFCPQMKYLNVECLQNMNIQLFLKKILKQMNEKYHEYLRSLCIYTKKADERMVKELNEMISQETLLGDYTIHRQLYNIHLKWK